MRINPLRAFKAYRVLERANDALVARVEQQDRDIARFRAHATDGIEPGLEANIDLVAASCPYRFRVGVKSMRAEGADNAHVVVVFTGWPSTLLSRIRQAGYVVHSWDRDECVAVISEAPCQQDVMPAAETRDKTA